MAKVIDVAEYILRKQGRLSAIKLQKLVYYAQAWHTVARGEPLFSAPMIAHQYGPLCTQLWELHRGKREVSPGSLSADRDLTLSEVEGRLLDSVLAMYGSMSMTALVERTHRESPWKDERDSGGEITWEAMLEFYSGEMAAGRPSPDLSDISVVSFIPSEIVDQLVDESDDIEAPDDYSGFLAQLRVAAA